MRKAFTLIELLVVISIIALLIAILLPALSSARDSAKSIQCLSNLKNYGVAHAAYQAENDGVILPPDAAYDDMPNAWKKSGRRPNQEVMWPEVLAEFMVDQVNGSGGPNDRAQFVKDEFICPAYGPERDFRNVKFSYGQNVYLYPFASTTDPRRDLEYRPAMSDYNGTADKSGLGPYLKIGNVTDLSDRIITGDSGPYVINVDPRTISVGGSMFFRKREETNSSYVKEPWKAGDPNRHGIEQEVANYLYMDGHASTEQKEDAARILRDPQDIFDLVYDIDGELNH